MIIRQATPEELAAPAYDRRRENPGRAPLVPLNDWKRGEVLDISADGRKGVRRSVIDGARKRGWPIRELSHGVFLRLPLWNVRRENGDLVRAGVAGVSAEEAVVLLVGDVPGYSAVLQE